MSGPPLGRSIAAGPGVGALPVAATPALTGGETRRANGAARSPPRRRAAHSVSSAGVASTPTLALRRYALAYVNSGQQAISKRAMRQLAATSIGDAKLTGRNTRAAARNSLTALNADHVANTGQVVAIAAGQSSRDRQMGDRHPRAPPARALPPELPPGPHVTLSPRPVKPDGGWVVSRRTRGADRQLRCRPNH